MSFSVIKKKVQQNMYFCTTLKKKLTKAQTMKHLLMNAEVHIALSLACYLVPVFYRGPYHVFCVHY